VKIVPALLLASCLLGCGARDAGPAGAAPESAALAAQADRWDEAIVRKDRAAIEANMSADFRQIDGDGNVETRESFVAGLLDPALEIDPYTVEDFDIRFYGDVALLSGRTRMTGRHDGEPFTSHYRYIDVYARQDGAWKVVSVQITRIPGK
jgi:ketosteroid isomerase-like protein